MKTNLEETARMYQKGGTTALMQGSIDMHYHMYPEIMLDVKSRVDDIEAMKRAREGGMRGIVLKNHLWPTTSWAYYLKELVSDITIFPSITLNTSVGGPNVWVVEAAAKLGAKVVWMPTWSAARSVARGGFTTFMKTWFPRLTETLGNGISVLDSSGHLVAEVREIIKLAKELKLVISTGHLSPKESLAIAREAERIDFEKVILCHPVSFGVGATLEEIREISKSGAYIELDAMQGIGHGLLNKQIEIINELGAEHCILSSDSFGDWPPPSPEFLRTFIGLLKVNGAIDDKSIRTMITVNTAKLLDMPQL